MAEPLVTKICNTCKQEKPLEGFHKDAKRGLKASCRPCLNKVTQRWRDNNPEKAKASSYRQYAIFGHTEKYREQRKAARMKRKYGITIDIYNETIVAQEGLCAICGKRPDCYCIDHDHETGKFRGLLCSNCNRGMGLLGDDIGTLQSAANYLRTHQDGISLL